MLKSERLIRVKNNKNEKGIKQLADKTYFVRVTRRVNGERVERRGKAVTKAEARKLLASFTLELEAEKEKVVEEISEENNGITFEEANSLWLSSLPIDLALGTKNTYGANYNTIIRVIEKDKLAEEIDLKDIEALKKGMAGNSISHINTCIKQVNRVLSYCKRLGYIEKNGVEGFELVKQNKNSRIAKKLKEVDEELLGVVYSPKEISGMLNVLQGSIYEVVFRLGYGMGMRIAEILGLTWDNVNLEDGTIDIIRQQQYYSRIGYVMTYAKSEKSTRHNLFMSLDLWDFMKELYEVHRQKGFLDVKNIMQDEEGNSIIIKGFVCCDEKGSHLKQSAPTVMQKILEKSGYKGFYTHSLRKTHTSELASSGMSLAAVRDRLGHESIETTLAFYTYTLEDDMKKLNEFIRNRN